MNQCVDYVVRNVKELYNTDVYVFNERFKTIDVFAEAVSWELWNVISQCETPVDVSEIIRISHCDGERRREQMIVGNKNHQKFNRHYVQFAVQEILDPDELLQAKTAEQFIDILLEVGEVLHNMKKFKQDQFVHAVVSAVR